MKRERFRSKLTFLEAAEVTADNMEEAAAWCGGKVDAVYTLSGVDGLGTYERSALKAIVMPPYNNTRYIHVGEILAFNEITGEFTTFTHADFESQFEVHKNLSERFN